MLSGKLRWFSLGTRAPYNSTREAFASNTGHEKPAHLFLRSVHNITIECGWLDFRKAFGHNFTYYWDGPGSSVYDQEDPTHR